MLKPRFNVGDRVRVRIAKDVIAESEIVCDVGEVVKVIKQFSGRPHERIIYEIKLDNIYAGKKYFSDVGPIVQVGEGWNMVGPEIQSIEAEC